MRTVMAELKCGHTPWQITNEGLQMDGLWGTHVQVSVALTPFLVIPGLTSVPSHAKGPKAELQNIFATFLAV